MGAKELLSFLAFAPWKWIQEPVDTASLRKNRIPKPGVIKTNKC